MIRTQEQEIKLITENDYYISWLESFTEKYVSFENTSWEYDQDKISESDYQNVRRLEQLFSIIDRYAANNYCNSYRIEYGCYYGIKYNGIGYKIGIMVGQGSLAFCERTTPEEDYIDFRSIITSKEAKSTERIKKELEKLSLYIEKLMNEDDIPPEVIRETTEHTLNFKRKPKQA